MKWKEKSEREDKKMFEKHAGKHGVAGHIPVSEYKIPKQDLLELDGPVDPYKTYGKAKKGLKTAKKGLKKPSKGTIRGVK